MKTEKKHSNSFLVILKVALSPVAPALAGYGMFWWYAQPFGIDVPVGVSILIGCYIAGLLGYYVGGYV